MERFENMPEKEPQRPEIYFSVSNLVHNCIVVHEDGTREVHAIASLGKVDKDGHKRFQAIGGGAKMTDEAIELLKQEYSDIRFRSGEEHDDARFYIPLPKEIVAGLNGSEKEREEAKKASDDLGRDILARFVDLSGDAPLLKQNDVKREVAEELSGENLGFPPVLSKDEANDIALEYSSVASPIEWENATSGRSDGTAGYFRIFYLYDMVVSEPVFEKLKQSSLVRFISAEDKATIRKATEEGYPAAVLADGSTIVENVFPDFYEERP